MHSQERTSLQCPLALPQRPDRTTGRRFGAVRNRYASATKSANIQGSSSLDSENALGRARVPTALLSGDVRTGCQRRRFAGARSRCQPLAAFAVRYAELKTMQEYLEIAFHNLERSPTLETQLKDRFARLEKLCDRLTWCRITVEATRKQHPNGNLYEIHIDMGVPGAELAVTRRPVRGKPKYPASDVHIAIRDAFAAAERQLKKYNRQRTGEIKRHAPAFLGRVAEVRPEEDWGYLVDNAGKLIYFNRTACLDGAFKTLKRGDTVDYVQTDGEYGPTAVKVWRKTFPAPQAT